VSKEKQKGTAFEGQVVAYMRGALGDDRIERRATSGKNDRGDISGVLLRGRRVVLECKNHKAMKLSEWLEEAEDERRNDDADFAFVIHKKRGCGDKRMGDTYVTCTLENLCALIAGSRWHMGYDREERENFRYMASERGIDEDG